MIFWTFYIPLAAGFSILFFWFKFKSKPKEQEILLIDKHSYDGQQVQQERQNTLVSLGIFTLVGIGLDVLDYWNLTQIYHQTDNTVYLVLSFFAALFINDVYFYFTHRLLHWKPVFKKVHFIHHRSHHPNPLSAFSFHPVEAIIQIAIVPILALLLPLNFYVLAFFTLFMLFMSVYGHCGYELRASKPKVFDVFNNAIHHDQHHTTVKYNFGLYLTLWDRLFKTIHPLHQQQTDEFRMKGKQDQ
jgi:lathosterol oxidase